MGELQIQPTEREPLTSKDHYSYVTRSIIRLFNQGTLTNVATVDVEPEYGYTTRLNYVDESVRITYGNDLGLNTGAAEDLAKDKGHTKFLLRNLGINCPEGETFLMPWWVERIGQSQLSRGNNNLRTADDADQYLRSTFGYPAYIKPVNGSKGGGIYKVRSEEELQAVFEEYNTNRISVALIEKPITMPDYRIVMLDGEMISAYRRDPLAIEGDGTSTIRELISLLQQQYFQEGRDTNINIDDPRIAKELIEQSLTLDSVIEANKRITLVPVSNLSMGGTSLDVSKQIDPVWVDLCSFI